MDSSNSRRLISEAGRLRDQPLLPLPSASSASSPASLGGAIQTVLPPPQNVRDIPEKRYVRAVLARYLWLPDTPSQSSRHDRRLAQSLFGRGVPLLVVEAALLLATTRRVMREPWLAPLPRVRGIVFFAFPLHPPGKPGIERAEHLFKVDVPMLFLQGPRDSLATPGLLQPIIKKLGERATLHMVAGADHSFKVLKSSGRTDKDVLEEISTTAAGWMREQILKSATS